MGVALSSTKSKAYSTVSILATEKIITGYSLNWKLEFYTDRQSILKNLVGLVLLIKRKLLSQIQSLSEVRIFKSYPTSYLNDSANF